MVQGLLSMMIIMALLVGGSWGFQSLSKSTRIRIVGLVQSSGFTHGLGPLHYKRPSVTEPDEGLNTQLRDGAYFPASDEAKSTVQKALDYYEDNVPEYNGFTEVSELINGRLAMAGLVCGFVKEYYTGETLLEQVGIGRAPWETLREITTDWGALLVMSLLVVAFSIFNVAPPPVNAQK